MGEFYESLPDRFSILLQKMLENPRGSLMRSRRLARFEGEY